MSKNTGVVVTTEHRGVFFGYVEDPTLPTNRTMLLKNARMCVYWPADNRGVVGLASSGPVKGAKISPPAPEIQLNGITSVMTCSPAAVNNWEKGLWN